MKAKIDLDKFVLSLIKRYYEKIHIDPTITKCWLDSVLEDQGLEYKDGEIVEIEQESEDAKMLELANIKCWLEKQDEQKPTDKVEPKFKVGDWIINRTDATIMQIVNNKDFYESVEIGGQRRTDTYNYVEWDFRLWTIEDAKDGDILIVKKDKSPFIFKGFDKFHPECPIAYCGIDDYGIFIVSSGDGWWTDEAVCPATKEQRDFLFQKMKEAGYEWDAEKKELRKIEQKPKRVGTKEATGTLKEMLDNIDPIELEETRKEMLDVDAFDAELNALLKKYEYLPKEQLLECMNLYVLVLGKMEERQ